MYYMNRPVPRSIPMQQTQQPEEPPSQKTLEDQVNDNIRNIEASALG